jgi:hypothetical protein
MSTMQKDEVLQQRMPEERLGFPPPLVCCSNSIILHLDTKVPKQAKGEDKTISSAAEHSATASTNEFPSIIMSNIRARGKHDPTSKLLSKECVS